MDQNGNLFFWFLASCYLYLSANQVKGNTQETLAFQMESSSCQPKFKTRGSYTAEKCMANCLMEIDGEKCHGIEIDKATQMCQLVSFNFTALACLGQPMNGNKNHGKEVFLKSKHVVNLEPISELYLANVRFGEMNPISGNTRSLASLTFPFNFPMVNPSLKIEYHNGFLACEAGNWCYFWDFNTSEYVPHSYLENKVHYGIGLFADTVVIVHSQGQNLPMDVLEPSNKTWVKGPPLNFPRSTPSLVTLNSTSIMAIGGRSGRNVFNAVEILSVGSSSWHTVQDYPQTVVCPACTLLTIPPNDPQVLCVGGYQKSSFDNPIKEAYIFDLNIQKWSHAPEYDLPAEMGRGHFIQWKNKLYYKPNKHAQHYVKDLDEEKRHWKMYDFNLRSDDRELLFTTVRTFQLKP